MKSGIPEELAFLTKIRGRYADNKMSRFSGRFYAFLFGFCMPTLFLSILFSDGFPPWPMNADHWFFVLLSLSSVLLGWIFLNYHGAVYEFTDLGITIWFRNKKRHEIRFDEIQNACFEDGGYGASWLILGSGEKRINILLYPSLRAEIAKAITNQENDTAS